MRPSLTRVVALFVPVLLACLAPPGTAQRRSRDLGPTITRAADADRSGDADAGEWARFVDGVRAGEGDEVDTGRVMARVFRSMLRPGPDGRVTPDTLWQRLDTFDANDDGVLDGSETKPGFRRGVPGSPDSTHRFNQYQTGEVLILAADLDGDGVVDAGERGEFIDSLPLDADGAVADEAFIAWIRAAEDRESGEDRRFSPIGLLQATERNLDEDGDGVVDVADLERHFAKADTDANGAVSSAELEAAMARARERFRTGGRSDATEEERARGPLMPWQRNLDDALALVEATGKPLLICVNMDDEVASESLALSRYRDPAFVELARGFVPILASPNRHRLRDHDDRGRRVVDPKFGRLVESEHVDIEPVLYRRYFGGQRVAPRHVGVAPDGTILFDLKLLNDLSEIDAALREHGRPGDPVRDPATMSEDELLASPEAAHRDHLEARFVRGDARTRASLAARSLSATRRTQHPEILRMALYDPEPLVRRQAVWTIVQLAERVPPEFLPRALRLCEDEPEAQGALLDAIGRLAATTENEETAARARRLQRVFRGLRADSDLLDVERWSLELSWAPPADDTPPSDAELGAIVARLDELDRMLDARPGDRAVHLARAAEAMRYARHEIARSGNPTFLLEDVVRSAEKATSAERPNGRALAYLAWARWLLGDTDGAAESAARAAGPMQPWAGTPLGLRLLEVIADTRTREIYSAMRAETEWAPELLADVCAAHELILEHPMATEEHVVGYLGFLDGMEAWGRQARILRRGLERFPLAGRLHAYLRNQELRDEGAEGLERVYDELAFDPEVRASIDWYWGLATLMAAERHVQNGEQREALAAYDRAVLRFWSSVDGEPDFEGSAAHYVCMARAGSARIHADAGEWSEAVAAIREGVTTSSNSVWARDGLGNTARDNAEHIYQALRESGQEDQAENLKVALAESGLDLGG